MNSDEAKIRESGWAMWYPDHLRANPSVLDAECWTEDGYVCVASRCPECGSRKIDTGPMGEKSCCECGAWLITPKRKFVPVAPAIAAEKAKAAALSAHGYVTNHGGRDIEMALLVGACEGFSPK